VGNGVKKDGDIESAFSGQECGKGGIVEIFGILEFIYP